MRVDKISTNISHGPFAVADLLVDVAIALLLNQSWTRVHFLKPHPDKLLQDPTWQAVIKNW